MRAVRTATAPEIATGRKSFSVPGPCSGSSPSLRSYLGGQNFQQLVAHAGNVASSHGQDGVSRFGDLPEHAWDIALVGYVVDLGSRTGANGALADRVHDELAAQSWFGHLARTVNVGHEDGVREGEGLAELAVEGTGARVAVRLEDRYHSAILRAGRLRHLQSHRELRRVVGVVVDDPDLTTLPFQLETPPHTAEIFEAYGGRVGVMAQPTGDARRRQRIKDVVPPCDPELDRTPLFAAFEEGVGAGGEYLRAKVSR